MSTRRSVPAALASTALLLALMACSDGTPTTEPSATPSVSSSTTTATAQDAACADAAALRSSLEALTKVEPLQDGLTALNAAMADVKTSLDTAVASASAAITPDVEQVRTAFADLQAAASRPDRRQPPGEGSVDQDGAPAGRNRDLGARRETLSHGCAAS